MPAVIFPLSLWRRLLRRIAGPRRPPAPSIRRPWSKTERRAVAVSIAATTASAKSALKE